jgi:hypothetical protein
LNAAQLSHPIAEAIAIRMYRLDLGHLCKMKQALTRMYLTERGYFNLGGSVCGLNDDQLLDLVEDLTRAKENCVDFESIEQVI